jgi:hypothetical protein
MTPATLHHSKQFVHLFILLGLIGMALFYLIPMGL